MMEQNMVEVIARINDMYQGSFTLFVTGAGVIALVFALLTVWVQMRYERDRSKRFEELEGDLKRTQNEIKILTEKSFEVKDLLIKLDAFDEKLHSSSDKLDILNIEINKLQEQYNTFNYKYKITERQVDLIKMDSYEKEAEEFISKSLIGKAIIQYNKILSVLSRNDYKDQQSTFFYLYKIRNYLMLLDSQKKYEEEMPILLLKYNASEIQEKINEEVNKKESKLPDSHEKAILEFVKDINKFLLKFNNDIPLYKKLR